jgi:hypothetical protein
MWKIIFWQYQNTYYIAFKNRGQGKLNKTRMALYNETQMIAFARFVLNSQNGTNQGRVYDVSVRHLEMFHNEVTKGVAEHSPGDEVILALWIPELKQAWKAKVNKAHVAANGKCRYDVDVSFSDGKKSRFQNIEQHSIMKIDEPLPEGVVLL